MALDVPCQKFASYVALGIMQAFSPAGAKYRSPGRKPWGGEPSPRLRLPSPAGRERGRGRGWHLKPTACAVGYDLAPASQAEFLSELLTQDTSVPSQK